jgi:hypothetical protein
MSDKQLRNEVQTLRDELAIMKRKFEDIIYNLDDDNFSSRFVKEKGDMKTSIEITAEGIKTKVSKEDLDKSLKNYSTIEQTAEKISSTVTKEFVTNLVDGVYATDVTVQSKIEQTADGIYAVVEETYETKDDALSSYSTLSSRITAEKNKISAIINGDFTEDLLNNYLTGIEITPNKIKMIATDSAYSTFTNNGLRFYDESDQVEGWAIEPSEDYGGVLNYYINGDENEYYFEPCYTFGSGQSGVGYSNTDMVLKAINGQRGRFVVDVTESANKEVKFVGLSDWSDNNDTPRILANNQLLATQNWVLENAGGGGGGSNVAVFA